MDSLDHVHAGAHAVGHAAGTAGLLADHAHAQGDVLVLGPHVQAARPHLHKDEVHAGVRLVDVGGVGELQLREALTEEDLAVFADRLLALRVDIKQYQLLQRELLPQTDKGFQKSQGIGAAAADDTYIEFFHK